MRHSALTTCVLLAWFVSAPAQAQPIVAETFMIPAVDPGIQLHVRNKHVEGRDNFAAERIVLFVHGATYPSETSFRDRFAGRVVVGSCRAQGLRRLFRRRARLWPLHASCGDG